MATIKDVAHSAGVSIATVSNVINNKGGVSDEKYDAVMSIINEMNYRPSIIAKNLKKRNTRYISVIMPNYDHHYTAILRGIQSILDKENYLIIPKITNDDSFLEQQILKDLIDMDVCGHLIVPASRDLTIYNEMVEKKIPIIFLERKIEGFQFSAVVFDNKSIIENLAKNNFEKFGRDQVMLVVGNTEHSCEADCVEGFSNAWMTYSDSKTEVSAVLEGRIISGGPFSSITFFSLFDEIEKLQKIPKCFIVSNSQVAYTLQEVLHIIDCDSTVVTLDADEWRESNLERGNFEKIPRNALQLGIEGANLLLEYIKNPIVFENTMQIVTTKNQMQVPNVIKNIENAKKNLKILLLESPASNALEKITKGFKQRFGYSITFDIRKYSEIYEIILKQMSEKKADHDIIMVDIPWIEYFNEKGFLYDLNEFVKPCRDEIMGDYPLRIRKAFNQNGPKLSGFPITATVQLLFYRKDLFESVEMKRNFMRMYGFELHPPRTWTEFNIVAAFFTREINKSSPVEFGTAVCGANATGIVDEFLPRMWAFGGNMLDENGNPNMHSLPNIRALNNLKETYKLVPEGYSNGWWDDELKMLLTGKCAMIQSFSSMYSLSAASEKFGDFYNNIGVMNIPSGKPVLGGWILGINAYCDKANEAFEYIKWVLSSRHKTHNAMLGWVLPMRSVYENTILKLDRPWMADVWDGFEIGNKRELLKGNSGKIADPYWLDNEFAKCIFEVLQDKTTTEESLIRMDEIMRI